MRGDSLSEWRGSLRSQCSEAPPRLSVEDAVTLYDSADINELMHVAMLRRRSQVPGNEVTSVSYTHLTLPTKRIV